MLKDLLFDASNAHGSVTSSIDEHSISLQSFYEDLIKSTGTQATNIYYNRWRPLFEEMNEALVCDYPLTIKPHFNTGKCFFVTSCK